MWTTIIKMYDHVKKFDACEILKSSQKITVAIILGHPVNKKQQRKIYWGTDRHIF